MDKSKLLLWQFREISQINKNTVVVYNDYLQRQMILKILPRQNLPVLKDIMKIKHPNLMEIYDVMDDGINCNCLCEFVFGNNLDKIVYNKMGVDPKTAEKWMVQLCKGVEELHNRNIIHRDITPNNVMIDYEGNIKLIDFNISRERKQSASRDTTVMGTAGYASPEQFGFTQTGFGADIYAMGVLLNFMLTGKMPNEKLCSGKYASIVKKATQIKEEDRYSNVYQMELALQGNGNEKLSFADKFLLNLPGFRSNKTSHKVIAIIGYVLYFILLYCAIDVTFINGDVESLINGFVAWSLVPYICFFDVGNVSRFLGKGTQQSKKTILKIIGVALMVIIPNLTLLLDKV